MMMDNSPLFDVSKETNESSHALFKKCFPDGFAWELLELQSGKIQIYLLIWTEKAGQKF